MWNNTNALVTVHFNTPVARARLVPRGQDLHFIVELRSAATPTWKMSESTGQDVDPHDRLPQGRVPAGVGGEVGAADGRPAEPGPARSGAAAGEPASSSDPAP
ncbi:MAG: hypothetical protein KIS78_04935 [Labilithrix sp.]|nr:hypothetical protein [Labilithrix sp.]